MTGDGPGRDDAVQALCREGGAALQRGDLDAAESAFGRAVGQAPEHAGALHMLGIVAAQRGRPAVAESLILRARAADPRDHNIHNSLGNVLCALGRHDEAEHCFEKAVALRPDYADAHANHGRSLLARGRAADALPLFDRVIALRPDMADARFQKALALAALGRDAAAVAELDRLLALQPLHAAAHLNRAQLLHRAGRHEEALVGYGRAVAAAPASADAQTGRGSVLLALQRLPEALESLDRAIALNPRMALAHCMRADVLAGLERLDEALAGVDCALVLDPALAEARNNRGVALRRLGRPAEALRELERAVSLKPGYAAAHANLGVVLLDLGRAQDARAALGRAIALQPERADFHNMLGNVLQELDFHDDALAAYAQARVLRAGFAEAEWNESVCRLLRGDFAGGWPLYESRWRNGQVLGELRLAQPPWDGRPFDGTLLVWGEQGIGDQIHQLGMLGDLAQPAAGVVVAVAERLLPLARRSFPGMRITGLQAAAQAGCDAQIPLGSLGRHARRSWADFPRGPRAYLKADAQQAAMIARALPAAVLRCGLSWRSAAPKTGPAKSIALSALAPLLAMDGVQFIDLQYGDTAAERAQAGGRLIHVDGLDVRNDLDGLAALIGACDVVVTVSNTTAHLAGALGKPVLLMLTTGVARHWYWHEGRADSPWYPSLRLFRQTRAGGWPPVLDAVAAALREMLVRAGR